MNASTSSFRAEPQLTSRDEPTRAKVVVVTGASSGLGLETAKQLARQGAEVVMISRDRARGEQARSQVASVATGRPPVVMFADLSVQGQVRRVADEVKARYHRIDVLINNAGSAFNRRQKSPDGVELTWATNHLAPFLLTDLLLPALLAAPAGRVVNVTASVYSHKLDLDNLDGQRKYSWMGAYRISKLGVVLFTTELARRIEGSGVAVVAVSPVPSKTDFGGSLSGVMASMSRVLKHTPMLKQADRGAEPIVWAATAPEVENTPGAVYMRHKQLRLKGAATDPALAAKVWAISEKQTGIDPARSPIATLPTASRAKS
jgi:NAD(P)-dependent dehydrogenase (short-subunit alcohol dehydrogenase family)